MKLNQHAQKAAELILPKESSAAQKLAATIIETHAVKPAVEEYRRVLQLALHAMQSDGLWPITGANCPVQLTGEYESGGSFTSGPNNCAKTHLALRNAITAAEKLLKGD